MLRGAPDLGGRVPGSGRILNIERRVFHPDRVRGADVFRLPQMPLGLYVTGDFVSRAASADLRGVGFEPVWQEEGWQQEG